ncbi:MAG: DNA polymerase III subunit epsilon [Pseudomonadales bacterium]|nr:DNA polymerase III subunit epsilon [Pseudomonadales bacterium]
MRQIVLDTETTGLEVSQGNRILEIGCVEVVDRKLTQKHYHQYVNPGRDSEEGALNVHGISTEFLKDKPKFSAVWDDFLAFIKGAELIIHNAPFDVAFINEEMRLISPRLGKLTDYCTILDSLTLAKQKHPGQKNNLDALCRRYDVDNSQRELHGALLDAEILADVYLLLTGGQVSLGLDTEFTKGGDQDKKVKKLGSNRGKLRVIRAVDEELEMHEKKLDQIESEGSTTVWRKTTSEGV